MQEKFVKNSTGYSGYSLFRASLLNLDFSSFLKYFFKSRNIL